MNSLRRFIDRVEHTSVTFWGWVSAFFIIVFLRTFIEPFTNILAEGAHFDTWGAFFVQPLWFFAAFIFLFLVLHRVTQEDIKKVSLFSTVVLLPVLFIPPIVDIVFSGPQSIYYAYISGSYTEIAILFATLLLAAGEAVSLGMKLAAAALVVLSGIYIYAKTASFKKVITGVFLIYVGFFFLAGISLHTFALFNAVSGNTQSVSAQSEYAFYFPDPVANKQLTHIQTYPPLQTENASTSFSVIVSSVLATLVALLSTLWYAVHNRRKFLAVCKNIPFMRAVLFYTLIGAGVALGITATDTTVLSTPIGIFAFGAFLLSFFFAGMYTVWENDQTDMEIDAISNKHRPLVRSVFSSEEWGVLKQIFLLFAILFAFIAGYYALMAILAFIGLYYIYSSPPFRLKRVPVLSSGLVAAATMIAMWSGFFAATGETDLFAFPHHISLGVFLFFLLFENFKNIKDIEGDRAGGVRTIPNMHKNGIFFTGILAATAPMFFALTALPHPLFIAASALFGLFFYVTITHKPYRESFVFYTLYAFMIITIVSYALIA